MLKRHQDTEEYEIENQAGNGVGSDRLPETDISRVRSSQVSKLYTHWILNITHIQHLCLYLIIFHWCHGVDGGKMIRLIIFC